MRRWIERIKVQIIVSLFWRVRERMLRAVNAFQATEADGVWHLLRGIDNTDNPKVQGMLFEHMVEEESHADEFVRVYRTCGEQAFVPTYYEREDLFPSTEPIWKLIAYVHVGEVDATERFALLRDTLPEGPLREALATIVSDEEGHIDLTHDVLLKLGASEAEIRGVYGQVRRRRAWEHWLRMGKRVVNSVAVLLLSGIYFLLVPLFFLPARKKLSETVVEHDNNLIKRAG